MLGWSSSVLYTWDEALEGDNLRGWKAAQAFSDVLHFNTLKAVAASDELHLHHGVKATQVFAALSWYIDDVDVSALMSFMTRGEAGEELYPTMCSALGQGPVACASCHVGSWYCCVVAWSTLRPRLLLVSLVRLGRRTIQIKFSYPVTNHIHH